MCVSIAVSRAAGVYYNYTQELECFDYNKAANPGEEIVLHNWVHQYCTELFGVSAMDGGRVLLLISLLQTNWFCGLRLSCTLNHFL